MASRFDRLSVTPIPAPVSHSRHPELVEARRVAQCRRMASWVYILRCSGGSYYIGVTANLERRLDQHYHGESRLHRIAEAV
jgi:hypothetical protein